MKRHILVIVLILVLGLVVGASALPGFAQPAKKDAATPAAPAGGSIALRGGKLLTITHGVIENGVLVMQNGKITAVGGPSTAVPRDAKVIDVTGMTVYPGLIDSETHLGLTEISADQSTNDLLEASDEIMPHMHVYDAFHAETALVPVARINGITNAIVAPAIGDTLPGQDSFIQLAGRSSEEMLLVRDIALPLNFTGRQRRNESFQGSKFPSTRMGMAAQLRQAFLDAQDYERKMAAYEKKKSSSDEKDKNAMPPKRDLKLEALLPYLRGQRPVVLAAEEANDLLTALSLANEFHLKIVLNHLAHAGSLVDKIAATGLPVIVGPIYEQPKEFERYDAVFKLPAELAKRGVKIAFASYDAHYVRNLPYAAGYATAFGLPHDEAMKAITLNPAEIWGVADKLGSLDAGKQANVVVANGDPLDVRTDVKHVFIGGEEIPLVNKQTQLRDQYW
ncbi:MAG TPA: amidohydrolase family protein [Candidatus Saccharimonadales bacterium]|jgi:imidazolonepropionase-like amidohydrolase|nr:amidohydrolase family protein [Candidatus Saccharimonadales bacterium]